MQTLSQIKNAISQNKLSSQDIQNFCNNDDLTGDICIDNEDEIWTQLLKRDYPQFNIIGKPKEQYEKIANSIGDTYFVSMEDYENKLRILYKDKPKKQKKVFWKVKILGNELQDGSKIFLALFNPQLPDIEKKIILPAAAYNSLKDAKDELCQNLGSCTTIRSSSSSNSKNVMLFKPKQRNENIKGFFKDVVNIYAMNKDLEVIFDEFTVGPQINYNNNQSQSYAVAGLVEENSIVKVDKLTKNEVTGGLRSPDSYTFSLNKVLEVVTIQKGTLPVGSFKYNIHKYPGDVDIFEKVDTCCSLKDAKEKVAMEIQQMIKRIRASQDIYLGDFKAGKDERFEINIGKWSEITTENPEPTLSNYNVKAIKREVQELRDEKLISLDEFNQFQTLIVDNPTFDEWQDLSDALRDHTVLRWTSSDLIQGFITLPGAVKLSLEDAIAQKTLVKVDVWARINGRYMEVTNFFMLTASDNKGKKLIQLTQELPDYGKSIARDVIFYSSPDHKKTLKALKRLWSLALFRDDFALAARISPLFSSRAAALHQINGEAEVLAMMLRKLPDPPLAQIMEQIDSFKPRIDQLNELSEKNEELFQMINDIVGPFYKSPVGEYDKFEEAAEMLDQLQKVLGEIVEELIYNQAKEAGLENPQEFL